MIVENPVQITEDELRKMGKEARGQIKKIYLHWTTGHYGEVDNLYHLCVDQDGKHDMNDTMLFAYISLKHNGNIINIEGFLTPRGVQKALFFYA